MGKNGTKCIDVTLLNMALFEQVRSVRLHSDFSYSHSCAQIRSDQVLLLTERLGSGVKPLEVAEQVKKKVDEIVEITNIWGLYSDQVPEGEPARLNFQGFIYFLGTFRKSRDYFISFEIDVEGSDGEEVYKVRCLAKPFF